MRKCLPAIVLTIIGYLGGTELGTAAELLRAEGHIVKWAQQKVGKPTTITYAILTEPYAVPAARRTLSPENCGSMRSFDDIVAVSNSVSIKSAKLELRAAFDAWEEVVSVAFVEVTDVRTANIIVGATASLTGRAFANLSYRGGQGDAPAAQALGQPLHNRPAHESQKRVSVPASEIEQAYVCLNPAERWKVGFDGNLDVYDLRFTFMHEIGHAIGLDHPGRSGSVMGYHYDERVSQLQRSDIDAARLLYGAPIPGK